jgi:hypothetical protein
LLRFSLHRVKATFPTALTSDDVKNALSTHINLSEIIDADFMNGTAYLHLQSPASKKTLLSISPISVSINNKNNTKKPYEKPKETNSNTSSNTSKNNSNSSTDTPKKSRPEKAPQEMVVDYDGKKLNVK